MSLLLLLAVYRNKSHAVHNTVQYCSTENKGVEYWPPYTPICASLMVLSCENPFVHQQPLLFIHSVAFQHTILTTFPSFSDQCLATYQCVAAAAAAAAMDPFNMFCMSLSNATTIYQK